MVSRYIVVLPLKVTVGTGKRTLGTFLLGMCLHCASKYCSSTVIWAFQYNVQTPSVITSGKVLFILTNLEHNLAAMAFVAAVDLQLPNLSAGRLHEYMGEVLAATVRAGLVLQQPFLKAVLTELLPTAVHQVRLT